MHVAQTWVLIVAMFTTTFFPGVTASPAIITVDACHRTTNIAPITVDVDMNSWPFEEEVPVCRFSMHFVTPDQPGRSLPVPT